MKARMNQSKKGRSILVTFHEGFSTYTITIPMPYAILFFSEGLHSALTTLLQSSDLQILLGDQDAQKAEIQDHLKHSLRLFDTYLKLAGR